MMREWQYTALSRDVPRPSRDVPRPSRDVSRPSRDVPRPSRDIPQPSRDVPRASQSNIPLLSSVLYWEMWRRGILLPAEILWITLEPSATGIFITYFYH